MLKKSLQLVNSKLRLPTRRLFSQKSSTSTRSFSSSSSRSVALVATSLVGFYLLSRATVFNKEALAEEVSALPTTESTTQTPTTPATSSSTTDNYHISPELNPLAKFKLEELKITLYQYTACPFCCKVRAFLDYYKIPYTKVEVDPVLKTQLNFSKDYRKVPVVIVNDKIQLNDSSFIITCITDLMRRDGYKPPVEQQHAEQAVQGEEEVQWRRWVDQKFVHTLAPNIYRTPKEAAEAFEYIMSQRQFSYLQQQAIKYAGSTVMYYVSKSLRKKHNIGDERQAIYDCGKTWMEAVGDKKFIGGNAPNLADLAAYGILTAIEDLTTFDDLVKNTKGLGEWFYRVKELVGETSGNFDDKQ